MTRFHAPRIAWVAVLAAAAGLPAAIALAAPAGAATTYQVTDTGSLAQGGSGDSDGYGINASGQITGLSFLSTTYTYSCGYPVRSCTAHPYHAFLYSSGQMTDLGTLGGHLSQGNAINLSDQVAGWADTSTGVSNATVWTGGKSLDVGALAPLAGASSIAYGINDSGQVVGAWGTNASSRPFLYSNGTATALPEPSDFTPSGCEARGIDNNGQIAGICADANGNGHLVLWSNGTVTDLGSVGSIGGVADIESMSLSSNGEIAGWAASGTAFVYSNGKITSPSNFWPNAINDNGVMVGASSIDSGGNVQDLDSLIPAGSGDQISNATAINDNGQIVANANAPDGDDALLLTP
jgi:probable HAF family extracellular repeat protein